MKTSTILRCVSLFMLIAAIGFVIYALHHPEGSFSIGLQATYMCYAAYIIGMVALFVISFFTNRKKKETP